jgi:hypothetical protein
MTGFRLLLLACCLIPTLPAGAAEKVATTLPGGPVFVRLKPISFSVIGADNKLQKQVSIQLDLELEPDKAEPALDPYRRKMLDAFLVALDELYSDRKPDDPPVDGDELKGKLLDIATGITGPGLIHGVLIMAIGERSQSR